MKSVATKVLTVLLVGVVEQLVVVRVGGCAAILLVHVDELRWRVLLV